MLNDEPRLPSGGAVPEGSDVREALADFSTWTTEPDEAFCQVEAAMARCPVAHSDQFDGFSIVMDYASAKSAALDWRRFSIEPSCFRPAAMRGASRGVV